MRHRKRDRHLPACVYQKNGAYYLVKKNRWTRIDEQQLQALTEAVKRALIGWMFGNQSFQHVHNRLRAEFNITKLADLPAADYDKAAAILAEIHEDSAIFHGMVSQLRGWFLTERVEARAPWTPHILRAWKKKIGEKITDRPNWIEMQRRLNALKKSSEA